jgi:hypothetical protein
MEGVHVNKDTLSLVPKYDRGQGREVWKWRDGKTPRSRDARLTQVCEYHGGATSRKKFMQTSQEQHQHEMEEDRAQVDLGIAVDVEERLEESAIQRQPKKRFVGRRAADAASSSSQNDNIEHNGAIEGRSFPLTFL